MSREQTMKNAPWTAEERREFEAEMTALNLQRCKVAGIAGAMIALWASGVSILVPGLQLALLRNWLLTCVAIYAGLMIMRQWVARDGVSLRLQRAYVLAFFVVLVGVCDGFFFVLSEQLASVSSFSRGMLVTAVIFVLPPARYLPVAILNEALLCGWLAWRGVSGATLIAFLDGTAGAVVGSVISWVLYALKRREFRQQRLIQRQHAEMNELMAITAHDLRSPLLGMKNLLSLATARAGLGRERLLAVIGEAARACDRLLTLVNELVTAHEAEHDAPVKAERGDLRAAVEAAVERARLLAQGKRVAVTLRAPEEAASARFEEPALAQVLDNLMSNAVKFSPPGAAVDVALWSRNGEWHVEIADEGPGVPEAERARLFRKYARGSATPTAGEGGSGLGLFIAQTLATRMGARVSFAPRAGGERGAVFRVELPRE